MSGSSRRQVEGARNSYSSVLRMLLGHRRDGFSIRTVDCTNKRDGFSIRIIDWTKDCFKWRIFVVRVTPSPNRYLVANPIT
jgi:hypothetical protein